MTASPPPRPRVGAPAIATKPALTDDDRWIRRPGAARAVRFLVALVPLTTATVVALLVSRTLPAATTLRGLALQWAIVLSAAAATARVARPVAKRLLPLSALLELTLVFPDAAPSRIRTAMRRTSEEELRALVERTRTHGLPADAGEAAQQILTLVTHLSDHDRITRGHAERVRVYTGLIAEEMGLDAHAIARLEWAGLLHDIGKLVVATEILNKPGKLDDDEYDQIKGHAAAGADMVEPLRFWLGDAVDAVGQHHERWDGNGYPYKLSRDEISLGARIISVADVFDVITARRSYKEPLSPEFARKEIANCAGTQFDPRVVRAFLAISLSELPFARGPLAWFAQLPVLANLRLIPALVPSFTVAAAGVTVAVASLPPSSVVLDASADLDAVIPATATFPETGTPGSDTDGTGTADDLSLDLRTPETDVPPGWRGPDGDPTAQTPQPPRQDGTDQAPSPSGPRTAVQPTTTGASQNAADTSTAGATAATAREIAEPLLDTIGTTTATAGTVIGAVAEAADETITTATEVAGDLVDAATETADAVIEVAEEPVTEGPVTEVIEEVVEATTPLEDPAGTTSDILDTLFG